VEDLVHKDGNFGPNALRNKQPAKAGERVRDMVGATQVEK